MFIVLPFMVSFLDYTSSSEIDFIFSPVKIRDSLYTCKQIFISLLHLSAFCPVHVLWQLYLVIWFYSSKFMDMM